MQSYKQQYTANSFISTKVYEGFGENQTVQFIGTAYTLSPALQNIQYMRAVTKVVINEVDIYPFLYDFDLTGELYNQIPNATDILTNASNDTVLSAANIIEQPGTAISQNSILGTIKIDYVLIIPAGCENIIPCGDYPAILKQITVNGIDITEYHSKAIADDIINLIADDIYYCGNHEQIQKALLPLADTIYKRATNKNNPS